MKTKPVFLKEANEYVKKYHRHSAPVVGCRFAIGLEESEQLIGVAICGRPIARLLDDGKTMEVLRVCTDGTKNANSFLYDKCRKIAVLMGYEKVITYTLASESGSSLKALRAVPKQASRPHGWDTKSRKRENKSIYYEQKVMWTL